MKATRVPPKPQDGTVHIEMTESEARVLRAVAGLNVSVPKLFDSHTSVFPRDVYALCLSIILAFDTMTTERTVKTARQESI